MRKYISFFIIVLSCLIVGCKQMNNPIVAKAFHQNLYLSEVIKETPYFKSKEDSLSFINHYVEDWILHKTILAYAKQKLDHKEQDFSHQINQYKEQLLINAFMQKITKDSSNFVVSLSDLNSYSETNNSEEKPEYRNMVKLNYIKLSNPSKIYKKVKELFFEDNDRMKATKQLEIICADTIEYYLDNEHWFYTDILEKELPFSFSGNIDSKDKFDFVQDGNRYLVLILDKKQQLQPQNPVGDKKMLHFLLQQKKRVEFVNNYKDSLLQKALLEKRVVVYPKVN